MVFRNCVALAVLGAAAVGCAGGDGGRNAPGLVSADTLAAWLADERAVTVLDTQPDSAFDAAHLPTAIRAHRLRITDLREVLPRDPAVPIVVYNADGAPPAPGEDLAREAAAYGFSGVYWLDGGLNAWKARGFNVDGSRLFPSP